MTHVFHKLPPCFILTHLRIKRASFRVQNNIFWPFPTNISDILLKFKYCISHNNTEALTKDEEERCYYQDTLFSKLWHNLSLKLYSNNILISRLNIFLMAFIH